VDVVRKRTVPPSSAAPASSRIGALNPEAVVSMTSGRGMAATREWTPTVANLLVLVVLEVFAFAALRMVINKIV
jgi:hypothetical protein